MALRLTALLMLLAVISGCAGGGKTSERIEEGMAVPPFALADISTRETISAAKVIQSHHATVITIWSMACPNCREALLDVKRVYEAYSPKSIGFLGINVDVENVQGVRALVKGEGIEFPVLWDNRRRVARDFRALDYTFSVFVVDRMGKFVLAQYDHPPDLERILAEKLDDILEDL